MQARGGKKSLMAEDGMMPPARRPQLNTNADFRKLLETPRAERSGGEYRSSKPKKRTEEAPKPKAKRPPRPKPEADEEKKDEGPSYRDRAEERRKGVNPDYERLTSDFSSLIGDNTNADIHNISVEDSKFLGGDVDHTHLVKGLDYALLQKVRGEITKDEDQQDSKSQLQKQARETEVIKFKSPSGRAVFNAIFSRPRTNQTELFQPGRTAFVYELEGGAAPDVPMTLRRSKADCPAAVEMIKGGMDTSVLERMVKIMSYMRGTSGKPGKMKKKDKLRMLQMMEGAAVNGSAKASSEQLRKPTGPADPDADIFGDAGRDYAPELPKSRSSGGAVKSTDDMELDEGMPPPPPPPPPLRPAAGPVGPSRPTGGYDAASAAYAAYGDGEPPPPPPPPPQAPDTEDLELDRLAGLAPVETPQPESRARAPEHDIIRKDTEDAYEECYPDFGGFNAAIVDSDEEDLTHMDSKEGKSRYDFNTEEQWEKYKANKEMMPKAAFQFGVKMSDGRRGHKQLGKGVEQKEQKQLRQIQSMLKKSHGDDYSHAFNSEARLDKEGPVTTKRRRI